MATIEQFAQRQTQPQERPYRTPPHNLEAEQALLGAILINNDAFDRVSDFLRSEHFVEEIHRRIFEIAGSLIRAGKLATPVTLKTFLGEHDLGGVTVPQYLARLASEATTIINAYDYGRSVYDLAMRRELISIGEDVVNVAYDAPVNSSPRDQIEEAERRLYQIAEAGRYDGGFQRFSEALKDRCRHGRQRLRARRVAQRHRDRADRPRPLYGRPAGVRSRHPRRPSRHGQVGARHQHRLQHRQGLSGANARRRRDRDRQWRRRRLLFPRNVGRTAGDPHHRRAVRRRLLQDPPRRHHRERFPSGRRRRARHAADSLLHRPDRRRFDRPTDGPREAAQAPAGARPSRGRLSPAAVRIEVARPRTECRN